MHNYYDCMCNSQSKVVTVYANPYKTHARVITILTIKAVPYSLTGHTDCYSIHTCISKCNAMQPFHIVTCQNVLACTSESVSLTHTTEGLLHPSDCKVRK